MTNFLSPLMEVGPPQVPEQVGVQQPARPVSSESARLIFMGV